MRDRNRHGFALVELLVVIGILTLLVGLLLPTLSRVRAAAQRTACLSNLRQIGLGLQTYQIDHADRMPVVPAFPVDPYAPTLREALEGYLDAGEIWRCPADQASFAAHGTSYEYLMGHYLMLTAGPANQYELMRELNLMPSLMPVVHDADGWHPGGPDGTDRNAVFLDGRAAWFHVSLNN